MEPTGDVAFGAPVYAGTAAPATAAPRQRASPANLPAAPTPVVPPVVQTQAPANDSSLMQTPEQFGAHIKSLTAANEARLAELHRDDTPQPKFEQSDPLKGFASLGGIIGVFGSLLSKQPLVAALNASASAMEALKQGNVEEYARKLKDWSAHRDYVMQVEQSIARQHQEIINNEKLTWQEKQAQLRALQAGARADRAQATSDRNYELSSEKFRQAILRQEKDDKHKSFVSFVAGAQKLSPEAFITANAEGMRLMESGTFTMDAGADILLRHVKDAKIPAGAQRDAPNIDFAARFEATPVGQPVQFGIHTLSPDDVKKIKKTTGESAGSLVGVNAEAWKAWNRGLSRTPSAPTSQVAKPDTGVTYTVGQIVNKDGKKYKVVGDPGPNPDVEEIK